MPYIHITHSPGIGLREYRAVQEAMGPEPIAGNLLSLVGERDGALHVVDVWESATAADRFAAERLFPAFERTGITPGPHDTVTAFEAQLVVDQLPR
ncbi:hypothetical protein ACWDSJ_21135 [Nocardia sp. NPDC003482]|uniref:hypothetical protein n=1 Tax=Nocardia sp. NPDC004068 TaxID=3364303 RepID=UPI0036D17FCF